MRNTLYYTIYIYVHVYTRTNEKDHVVYAR